MLDPATPRPATPRPDSPRPATPRPRSPRPDSRPPLLRKIVGEVLRRVRLEQRRTLADVARAARVSMPYLSELERGRKEASSEVLAAICAALSLDLSDLLTEVGRELAGRPVIRLDSARAARQAPPSASRPGDIQALLAA